jgi:adenine-specific DNA methylase
MDFKENEQEKLIESHFPYSTVSEIAYKESNAKRFYRPVLTLGKWFARRLGSVFRSILIYAALTTSEGIQQDKTNEWEKFWDLYLKEHSFQDLSILDPFMGGGTTIIEAIRLGFGSIIGGDLNPVAWFIVKKEIEEVDIIELENRFNMIASKLKLEILKYYKTRCIDCSNPADVMYFFWIKEIKCENCKAPVSLYRSYLFAYAKKNLSKAFFICPKCEYIFQANSNNKLMCSECNYRFNSSAHNAKHGKYTCIQCGFSAKIIETSAKQGRPVERMYAIEYYCSNCNIRKFKRVEKEDTRLYNQAYADFKQVEDHLPIPDQIIPMGAKTQELLNHRILFFKQMFNARQLLSLGKLLIEILRIKDQNVKEFFLISFIAALEYNNLLCEYHRKNHYVYNLFRKHAFPATLNPVENNVWGVKYGTGTFKNFFEKTIRIKKYCISPYEYYITDTGEAERKSMERSIKGKVVSSYKKLLQDPLERIYLYCDSSHDISIPDNQIDLVITDPPYYDNVQYAELSDFYYVWLKLALENHYPWFNSTLSPKKDEVVKNVKAGKTSEDYRKGLQAIFKEVSRVLKPKGLLILTFHHKKTQAWISLIQSLLDNNFYITSVYPVRAEMKTSTQIRGTRSIEYDAIFVCKQRRNLEEKNEISWEDMIAQIKDSVKGKLRKLKNNSRTISDEDQIVIQLGVGLKFFTQNYPTIKHKGKNVPLSETLEFLSVKFK